MRYPVTNTGSKEEFNKDWYIAQGFGNKTAYGFHEGVDINTRSGGDTDLGKEIKAISNGTISYYHKNSHPTTGFGMHNIYQIQGQWGVRWVMCSHLQSGTFIQQNVNEGEVIGFLGKSGTPVAHLHFSIFKTDPATLSSGIDTIARTEEQLNQHWEDPIKFIDTWMSQPVVPTTPSVIITDQTLIPLGGTYGNQEVQAIRSILNDQTIRLASQMQTIADLNVQLNRERSINGSLSDKIKMATEILGS